MLTGSVEEANRPSAARADEPLPEGHPLRQHEAVPAHAGAGRDELARTGRRRGPGVDVRASSSTTAITAHEAPAPAPDRPWTVRADPFSSHRAGFEQSHVPALPARADVPSLPRRGGRGEPTAWSAPPTSTTTRAGGPATIRIGPATRCSARSPSAPTDATPTGYDSRQLPPITFSYSQPVVDTTVRHIDPAAARQPPGRHPGPGVSVDRPRRRGPVRRPRPSRAAPGTTSPTSATGAFGPMRAGRARRRRWRRWPRAGSSCMDLAGRRRDRPGRLRRADTGLPRARPDEGWNALRAVPIAAEPRLGRPQPALRRPHR